MRYSNTQIVWMPWIGPETISTYLNRPFADACLAHPIPTPDILRKNVWKRMGQRGDPHGNLLDLCGGTLLIKGLYLKSGGVWMTLDGMSSCRDVPLVYCGHNDGFPQDRIELLRTFEAWVSVAQSILRWE
jgi:hypothetical protein